MDHREFCITYRDAATGDERKQRHISFGGLQDFLQFLQKRDPLRLDVGAVMALPPAWQEFSQDEVPVARSELKFDVDIDAYDALPGRTCCSGRSFCRSCWTLVAVGCLIMDAGLRSIAPGKLGWFYSGGRGMHCWVLDGCGATLCSPERSVRSSLARIVAPRAPKALSAFLLRVCRLDPVAVAVAGALVPALAPRLPTPDLLLRGSRVRVALPVEDAFLGWYFDACLPSAVYALRERVEAAQREARPGGPDAAALAAASRSLSDLTPDVRSLRARGVGHLSELPADDPARRRVLAAVARVRDEVARSEFEALEGPSVARAALEAALWCLLPRIDRAVTKDPAHLLKAPMTMHPDTRRLARFVAAADLATFCPLDFPDDADAESVRRSFAEWVGTQINK